MGRSERSASIRDVSRMAGVSVATVSRVIHSNGRFSPETEQRVRQAMEALNYSPNVMAQGLRLQAIPLIGVIVPDILEERYARMIMVAQEQLSAQGYITEVYNTRENSRLTQQYIDTLANHKARGLICVPDSDNQPVTYNDIPTVFFERSPEFIPDTRYVQIAMDNAACGRQAISWLMEKGRRRILILGDRLHISNHQVMMEAALDALNQQGLQPVGMLRVDPQRTTEAITALNDAMDAGVLPDAILCTSNRLTVGALRVLADRNIPPEQITVLGIGEHRLHRYGLLHYLAVREPLTQMAEAAVNAVLSLPEHPELAGTE